MREKFKFYGFKERKFWLNIFIYDLFFLCFLYLFFDKYLHLNAEMNTVYLRFGLLIIGVGALIAMLNPKNLYLRIIAYLFMIYGIASGILACLNLRQIHILYRSGGELGGIQGCNAAPKFILNLPFDYFEIFKVKGGCDFDIPKVANSLSLDTLQAKFFEIYTNGWYLFPNIKFINFAEFWLLILATFALILLFTLIFEILDKK